MKNRSIILPVIIISIIFFIAQVIIGFLYFDFTINSFPWHLSIVYNTGFFVFSFLCIRFFHNYFIVNKISEIFMDVKSNPISYNKNYTSDDVQFITKNFQQIYKERKDEIENLKDRELFRKDFIGNLSHELKTPLFSIQGYIETLLDGAIDDKEVNIKYIKRAQKSVERLAYIIEDLDLITKFDSGAETIKKTCFNIIETINNVIDTLEPSFKKRSISLIFDQTKKKVLKVFADEKKIHQVLLNLMSNSARYGVDDGTIEVKLEENENSKIIVNIIDNGLGIPKEDLSRVFERFYRVEKTRNRDEGGSGLGLSIVKHIIDAHDEKISVQSEDGVGSNFSFSLQLFMPDDIKQ